MDDFSGEASAREMILEALLRCQRSHADVNAWLTWEIARIGFPKSWIRIHFVRKANRIHAAAWEFTIEGGTTAD